MSEPEFIKLKRINPEQVESRESLLIPNARLAGYFGAQGKES